MRIQLILALSVALALTGCQTVYYGALEKFGIEKRDVLVDRVEDARNQQTETKETFTDALEAFTALSNYEGGELEATYDKLSDAYNASKREAERVADRIDAVEKAADALFAEWEVELGQYSNASLRRQSEDALRETRSAYSQLVQKMRRAESSMRPVLDVFQDQVLFLKHNLNARAIAALDAEVSAIQSQVNRLVSEMEASINEANAFIERMQ